MTPPLEGVVIRKSSRHVVVDIGGEEMRCSLRGRFRSRSSGRSPVVVGDRVKVSRADEDQGVLEEIRPRKSELTRGGGDGVAVVVAANVEQLLIVLAARDPPPRWALVDRMLAYAERDDLDPGIFLNKWDQVQGDPQDAARLEEVLQLYRELGYPVFRASVLAGEGLEAVTAWLKGKSTVLSGHSGVGKSTLLNALDPRLALRTGAVSDVTGKGRHTTSVATLLTMPFDGYVVDTPGFRAFSLAGVRPPELGRCFPEFRAHIARCKYADCLHVSEPRCAVLAALEEGAISKFRYDNYLQILQAFTESR